MTAPADREFRVFQRGEVRDLTLQYFAAGLRKLVNPETNLLFTEDEIASAIAPGSRWYRQAQAEDDYAQAEQHRALFMNDQLRIDRACTAWLAEFHANLWDPDGRLDPTPGNGLVQVSGNAGITIVGSTTIGDSSAYWGRDPQGNRYQVFDVGVVIGISGFVSVTMVAMDPGAATNPKAGTVITWSNKDPGMSPQATVAADFTGGTDAETDQAWASRMLANIRHKQGGGNDAQHRAWARQSSNAIDDAYIYPCAMMAGSVLVAVTQKVTRTGIGANTSPTSRIPTAFQLGVVTAYLVPPGSPVEPSPPFVLIVPTVSVPVDIAMRVSLNKGSGAGFVDRIPFPSCAAAPGPSSAATITMVNTGASTFDVTCPNDTALPAGMAGVGSDTPKMLMWDATHSQFVPISTDSVTYQYGNVFRVHCTALPANIMTGCYVCPQFGNYSNVAAALIAYFDDRGPGDLFAASDPRSARCVRFPDYTEERPKAVGTDVVLFIVDALAGTGITAEPPYLSATDPGYPASVTAGPNMLTLGRVGIYST